MQVARALVFDFNGTLSHDEPVLFAIYSELFAEHGRPLTEDDYFGALAGNTEEAIIGGWLGVKGDELAALVEERIDRYVQRADGSTIPETLRKAVRYAAARVPVAVVSGAYRREIEPVLERAALAQCVTALVAADDVTRGKPDPEGYVRALAALGDGLAPPDVVAFEDTEAGVASARAAGLRCLAVRGTHPDERLAGADEHRRRDRRRARPVARRMTWVIAHRGASADERENTLPAFERAIAVGADFVELDVQVSADGALVVFHDVDLDRLTPLRGPLREAATRRAARARHPDARGRPRADPRTDRCDGRAQVSAPLPPPRRRRPHGRASRTRRRPALVLAPCTPRRRSGAGPISASSSTSGSASRSAPRRPTRGRSGSGTLA